MEMYSSFDNLPKEIVVEIMFRLPPESLMRLKSINKSWHLFIRSLIDDPNFTAKHQRHAEEHPTMLLFNDPPRLRRPKTSPEMRNGLSKLRPQRLRSMFITWLNDNDNSDEEGDLHCVAEDINVSHLPNSLTRDRRTIFKVCHCNGVICFTKGFWKIFTLYSPVTGKFEAFQPKSIGGGDLQISGMGIGIDSGGNNFKVVRVLNSMRAQVFTPGTADSWREINMSIQDKSYRYMFNHVYLNGYCFWIARVDFDLVLCFDVHEEAFCEILLPNEVDAFRGNFRLTTVDDSVCLISYSYKEPIDVWVMAINGFSWRKWLRIDNFEGNLRPLAFWSSDELLMKAENGEMVSYNIETQKLRSISPKVMLGDVFYLGFYIKSLASMNLP